MSALDYKSCGKPVGVKTTVMIDVQKIMSLHGLIDVWRDLFPQQTSFTWREKALRLDYFLVSKVFKSIAYTNVTFSSRLYLATQPCPTASDQIIIRNNKVQVSGNLFRLC